MSLAVDNQTSSATPLHVNLEGDGSISTATAAIVVVGSGPVGMRCVYELRKRSTEIPIIIYGAEPWHPYDRVKLSSYLAGDIEREDLEIEPITASADMLECRYNCPIVKIDRQRYVVIDADGREQRYSRLILATGSKPFVPSIENLDIEGVFTFRSLSEADRLMSRTTRSTHTVVLGGGLLGLETARAMQRFNTQITIVEHNSRLMMQQLDDRAGELLKEHIESIGMNVILGDSVESAIGTQRLEGVRLRSGQVLDCDTLVIAAGIRPSLELARDANLVARKGIQVNDQLNTSDPNIHAIGECAEHDESVYGLVWPGLEMAAVLADRLTGGDAMYRGTVDATRLKVMQEHVFSAGSTGVFDTKLSAVKEYVFEDQEKGIYRKIRVHRDRLIGAIALGDWHETALLQDAITQQRRVWLWHLMQFKVNGYLWCAEEDMEVSAWPATATVCNCTGVTRGQLSAAMTRGCTQVDCLSKETRAGTVCGSCVPILAEMVGEKANRTAIGGWRTTLVASLASLLIAFAFLFGTNIPYHDTVQVSFKWDELWRDSLIKQWTGYSMLALAAVGALLSFRKRFKSVTFGEFNHWRIVHIVLGVLALVTLIAHTGLRVGDNLNMMLMINFLLLAAIGAVASSFISTEHLQSVAVAKRQRARWTWIHILLVWPLPVLLGVHIVKTYYY